MINKLKRIEVIKVLRMGLAKKLQFEQRLEADKWGVYQIGFHHKNKTCSIHITSSKDREGKTETMRQRFVCVCVWSSMFMATLCLLVLAQIL